MGRSISGGGNLFWGDYLGDHTQCIIFVLFYKKTDTPVGLLIHRHDQFHCMHVHIQTVMEAVFLLKFSHRGTRGMGI